MDLLFIVQLALPLVAVAALVIDNTLDKEPTADEIQKARSERRARRFARAFGVAVLVGSLIPVIISHNRDQQKDKENEQRSNEQKAAIASLSKQLGEQSKQIGEQSKQIGEQREDLLAESKNVEQKQAEAIEAQKETIKLQNRGLHQLNLISLDRTLGGIEISYTPNDDDWNEVMKIYQGLVPNIEKETSYYGAPLIATRVGTHWLVDFERVLTGKEGEKWFPPLTTEDPKNRGFEDIFRAASLPLHITWENGVETLLEPWRDFYPSALKLSSKRFVFILRPPLLQLNLGSLHRNSSITLRSRRQWIKVKRELTFRSLDPAVKLEQTLKLEWTNRAPSEKRETMFPTGLYRYVSGPHKLNMRFQIITR